MRCAASFAGSITRANRLRRHHGETGRCLLCTPDGPGLLGHLVHAGPHFAVHVLHAPRDPCHLRIVPREHGPSFARVSDEALEELARLLGRMADAVCAVLGHDEHNLLFHDHGVPGGPGAPVDPALHWHLEYRPRVTRTAGFEQMAGVGVCPSDPEDDARRLRARLDATLPG